jgi:hypothetical protein
MPSEDLQFASVPRGDAVRRRTTNYLGEEMSDYFLNYLQREHARLDGEIREEESRPLPDQMLVARLKKLKLAIKDQMLAHGAVGQSSRAA